MHSIQAGRSYMSMQKCWELILFIFSLLLFRIRHIFVGCVFLFCFSRKEEREYDWCKRRAGTAGIGTEE